MKYYLELHRSSYADNIKELSPREKKVFDSHFTLLLEKIEKEFDEGVKAAFKTARLTVAREMEVQDGTGKDMR